jgi:pimeloyl-ACP methyl ester carboxylesterase
VYYNTVTESIISYTDPDSPMTLWPALAASAKQLSLQGGRERIFYYDSAPESSAKTAVILIHGLGDEADSWRRLIPLLNAAGFRTLALDLPGFGRSVTPGRISLKGHIAAVLKLLEEAGPAVLAGSSMGAIVAEGTAFKRPDLVKGLILVDGCLPMSTSLGPGMIRSALPFAGKKWYRAYRTNPESAYHSLYTYYSDLERMHEADRRFLRERVMARVESVTQERAYFATLRSLIRTHLTMKKAFTRGLAAFPGKLLILWGDQDHVLPVDSASCIRELRPDAAFTLIPASGHLPQQENPAETAKAIIQWLED